MGEAGFAASKHQTKEPGMTTKKIFPFRNDLIFKLVFGQEGNEETSGIRLRRPSAAPGDAKQSLTRDITGNIIPI